MQMRNVKIEELKEEKKLKREREMQEQNVEMQKWIMEKRRNAEETQNANAA